MIIVDWTTFMVRYLPKKEIYVLELDDRWDLITSHEMFKIKCTVEKQADQAENLMFIERYFAGKPNIIKVLDIEGYEDEAEESQEQEFAEEIINEQLLEGLEDEDGD